MKLSTLYVQMLGNFTLTYGENTISCDINRSKRVWLLLGYLLYNHRRIVPQSELIGFLWGEEKGGANPAGALKTTLHRVRATLDLLYEDAGHKIIIHKNGGYTISPEISVTIDAEEFELLCSPAPISDRAGNIERLFKALSLYKGDFLARIASDPWAVPISTYYHNRYIDALTTLIPLLEQALRHDEAAELCREALLIDPYQEVFYQYLMRNLLALDKRQEVISIYEEMSKLLLSNFGVMPDQESRSLYREALKTSTSQTIPAGMVSEQLRETGPINGALLCDYDFFKMLYQAEARLIARSGDAVHIALFSIKGSRGSELPRRSLDLAMNNLEELICRGLRKGDIVTRCSPSQFMTMLPQANYENVCMVCDRLIRSFSRQYPHSPAVIDFTVHPLVPMDEAAGTVPAK